MVSVVNLGYFNWIMEEFQNSAPNIFDDEFVLMLFKKTK